MRGGQRSCDCLLHTGVFSDETTLHSSRQFFGFETKDQQGGDKDQVVESGKERLFTLPPPLSRSVPHLLWLVHKNDVSEF